MFDHIGFIVADAAKALAFYEKCLPPLGLAIIERHPNGAFIIGAANGDDARFIYVGPDRPSFWQPRHRAALSPIHLCLSAPDRGAVDEFHSAAIRAGGKDNGAPGEREPGYYAAYVIDPDGNNIEAACHDHGSASQG